MSSRPATGEAFVRVPALIGVARHLDAQKLMQMSNPHQGHARMWHYGETVGFRTSIQRFVDDHLTVIVLSHGSDVEARDLALKVAGWYLK